MAANGISSLPTKEERQLAKLELAKAKRQGKIITEGGGTWSASGSVDPTATAYRVRNEYDINQLPTKYVGNDIILNDHPSGLQLGRPWISSPTGLTPGINGAFLFDSSNYVSISNDGDFGISVNEDFCIEWFQYQTALFPPSYSRVFDVNGWPSESIGLSIENGNLIAWINATLQGNIDVSALVLEKWAHIAYVRTNNIISVYIDGNQIYTTTNSDPASDNITPMTIGYGSDNGWNGYLTSFRFVKGNGNSPYDATNLTITIPMAPLTDITGTKLLLLAVDNNTAFTDSSSVGKTVTNNSVTWADVSPFPI